MNNRDFRMGTGLVWLLVTGNLILTTAGAFYKVQALEISEFLLTAGLMLFFSTWVIVLSDMVKNRIYNKPFWIIILFVMPSITPLFYLIQRNRLLRMGSRLG